MRSWPMRCSAMFLSEVAWVGCIDGMMPMRLEARDVRRRHDLGVLDAVAQVCGAVVARDRFGEGVEDLAVAGVADRVHVDLVALLHGLGDHGVDLRRPSGTAGRANADRRCRAPAGRRRGCPARRRRTASRRAARTCRGRSCSAGRFWPAGRSRRRCRRSSRRCARSACRGRRSRGTACPRPTRDAGVVRRWSGRRWPCSASARVEHDAAFLLGRLRQHLSHQVLWRRRPARRWRGRRRRARSCRRPGPACRVGDAGQRQRAAVGPAGVAVDALAARPGGR